MFVYALTQRSQSMYSFPRAQLQGDGATVQHLLAMHSAASVVTTGCHTVRDRPFLGTHLVRSRLQDFCAQSGAFAERMGAGEYAMMVKDGYAADDIMALLHVVDWHAVSVQLKARGYEPDKEQRLAVWRAAEIVARVIDAVAPHNRHEQRATRAAMLFVQSGAQRELENIDEHILDDEHFAVRFSTPVPPRFMLDLLYRTSDWIVRAAQWSVDTPIYWFASREGHLYELTPFGVCSATLFHIDYDDGFSAPFGKDVGAAGIAAHGDDVPRALRHSFDIYKSAPTQFHVLPNILGVQQKRAAETAATTTITSTPTISTSTTTSDTSA